MTLFYESLVISEEDLDFQIETILSFLSSVHPYLDDPNYLDTCVEIRPILREGRAYSLSKSLILWNLDDKSINRLRKFLQQHNGVPSCLFYSVYSFDNHKQVLTKKGYKKGTIHSDNAIFTCEIALDFDRITEKEQTQYNELLTNVGIYPLWTFSGHGYQAHILLDEKLYDTAALKTFVNLFLEKGFPVDDSCIDAARLMRLPFTYNCKMFSYEEHEEREKPILCEVEQYTDTRYSTSELLFRIAQLPTVYPSTEKICKDSYKKEVVPEEDKEKSSTSSSKQPEADLNDIELKKIEYPYIQNYNIPEPIYKMLSFTPEGYRNLVLGFLIRYFKKHLKMPKNQIFEILSLWREYACKPNMNEKQLKDDFNRLYYSYNGLPYDSKLAKRFGYIEFQQEIILSKKDVAISNAFFHDFNILDGKLIRIYLAIRLLEHMDQVTSQENLSKFLGLSVRSVRSTLQELLKTKHCYSVKGNAKNKIPNTYHSHRLYDAAVGSSIFTYNDLKCYVKELFEERKRGNNELKLYLYMQYRFRTNEIFMSQSNFGRELSLEQNSISEIVGRLIEKGFLHVEKRPHETQSYFEKCYYTLLR